jgi:hypothetical protein
VLFLTEHHAFKVYWGGGSTAPLILDLGTRWRWVVSFTPLPRYPQRKSPWYTLDRGLGGPQRHSGHGGEEKNSQDRRESNPRTPIVQPAAQRYTDWTITAPMVITTTTTTTTTTTQMPRGTWQYSYFTMWPNFQMMNTANLHNPATHVNQWCVQGSGK